MYKVTDVWDILSAIRSRSQGMLAYAGALNTMGMHTAAGDIYNTIRALEQLVQDGHEILSEQAHRDYVLAQEETNEVLKAVLNHYLTTKP